MLHIAQDEDSAVFRGKHAYCLLQNFTELTVFQSLGRYFRANR